MPSIFNLYPQVINDIQNMGILVFFTLLYLTGIVSGILIFKKRYEGIIAALGFNFFQSLYIQMGTVTFFSTGFFSFIYLFPFGFDGNFGNPSFLFRLQPTDEWILGINLVASTAFALLLAAESEFHEKKIFPEHLY